MIFFGDLHVFVQTFCILHILSIITPAHTYTITHKISEDDSELLILGFVSA